MTTEFDRQLYANLLSEVAPRLIESEEEYDRLLPIVERLHFNKNLTPEERVLYRLLVFLVEKYEAEKYPIKSEPYKILQHIMESSGTRQKDLVGTVGSSGVVSEIVSGKREISKRQAKLLGDRFGVATELFI